jgi:hypothetical protein
MPLAAHKSTRLVDNTRYTNFLIFSSTGLVGQHEADVIDEAVFFETEYCGTIYHEPPRAGRLVLHAVPQLDFAGYKTAQYNGC